VDPLFIVVLRSLLFLLFLLSYVVLTLALLSCIIDVLRAVGLEWTRDYISGRTVRNSMICFGTLLGLWLLLYFVLLPIEVLADWKNGWFENFILLGLIVIEAVIIAFSFTNFNIARAFSSKDAFLMAVGPDCLRAADEVPDCQAEGSAVYLSADCSSVEGRWRCHNASYASCAQRPRCPGACSFNSSECTECRLSDCPGLEGAYTPIRNMAIANAVFFVLFLTAMAVLIYGGPVLNPWFSGTSDLK
jgi:hypothetical protein